MLAIYEQLFNGITLPKMRMHLGEVADTCTALRSQHLRFWAGVVQCRLGRWGSSSSHTSPIFQYSPFMAASHPSRGDNELVR